VIRLEGSSIVAVKVTRVGIPATILPGNGAKLTIRGGGVGVTTAVVPIGSGLKWWDRNRSDGEAVAIGVGVAITGFALSTIAKTMLIRRKSRGARYDLRRPQLKLEDPISHTPTEPNCAALTVSRRSLKGMHGQVI